MRDYPNKATHIICDYIESKGLNGPVGSIQPHIRMLCKEAKKAHPFLEMCAKNIYNNAEWSFIEKYFK